MPRIASNLAVLLLALTLGSCIGDDPTTCSTCPPDKSASLVLGVTQNGMIDSVQITIDSGPVQTVRRGRSASFEGLSQGTHAVTTVHWFSTEERVPYSQANGFQIVLQSGETRAIIFHNEFPLIGWTPAPARPGDAGSGDLARHWMG